MFACFLKPMKKKHRLNCSEDKGVKEYMNLNLRDFKELYPQEYKFEELISSDLLKKILQKQDRNYANCVAKRLIADQVALELAIAFSDGKLKTVGNVLVKDRAENGDWIVYDEVPVSFVIDKKLEEKMLETLDKYVVDNQLSYTDFNGDLLEEKSLREGMKW